MKLTFKKTNLKHLTLDKNTIVRHKTHYIAGGQDQEPIKPGKTDVTCPSDLICDTDAINCPGITVGGASVCLCM